MIDLSAVASTFGLLFVAEMGDKSQLLAMTLAHRYRPAPVIAGVFAAFFLLNAVAVGIGEALFRLVPRDAVLLCAGALFFAFAVKSWRDGDASNGGVAAGVARGAFAASFLLVFLAELGDKTQLAMVALAASLGDLWSVFIGGTAALWLVSLMGIVVGRAVLTRVPARIIHRAAAAMFFVFGALAVSRVAAKWVHAS